VRPWEVELLTVEELNAMARYVKKLRESARGT
jgi:hypothetical protein